MRAVCYERDDIYQPVKQELFVTQFLWRLEIFYILHLIESEIIKFSHLVSMHLPHKISLKFSESFIWVGLSNLKFLFYRLTQDSKFICFRSCHLTTLNFEMVATNKLQLPEDKNGKGTILAYLKAPQVIPHNIYEKFIQSSLHIRFLKGKK